MRTQLVKYARPGLKGPDHAHTQPMGINHGLPVSLRDHLMALITSEVARLEALITALDRLTDSKFITHQTLLDSQAEKVGLALASVDKAVAKAEAATERRFESVNEFRGTLTDQAREFVRTDYMLQAFEGRDQLIQALAERVRELELARSTTAGSDTGVAARDSNQRQQIGMYVGLAGVVLTVIALIITNVLIG